jgi:hypothetical protein
VIQYVSLSQINVNSLQNQYEEQTRLIHKKKIEIHSLSKLMLGLKDDNVILSDFLNCPSPSKIKEHSIVALENHEIDLADEMEQLIKSQVLA